MSKLKAEVGDLATPRNLDPRLLGFILIDV